MHAIRRVCHLARVCRLPHRAAASGRRLLRLLFLRFGQMSAGATGDVLLWQRWHIGLVAFLANTREYADGDIETDARYYRAHFSKTLRRSDQLESIVRRLRSHFTPQDIVKARAIEERLYSQTWRSPQYDVSPTHCREQASLCSVNAAISRISSAPARFSARSPSLPSRRLCRAKSTAARLLHPSLIVHPDRE